MMPPPSVLSGSPSDSKSGSRMGTTPTPGGTWAYLELAEDAALGVPAAAVPPGAEAPELGALPAM
jgi:hypothetical protein